MRRRGLNLPAVPSTEFVPRPGTLYASTLWGVSVRTFDGAEFHAEPWEPEDLFAAGRPFAWAEEPGTGVRYGRAVHPLLGSLAIARAVPLS